MVVAAYFGDPPVTSTSASGEGRGRHSRRAWRRPARFAPIESSTTLLSLAMGGDRLHGPPAPRRHERPALSRRSPGRLVIWMPSCGSAWVVEHDHLELLAGRRPPALFDLGDRPFGGLDLIPVRTAPASRVSGIARPKRSTSWRPGRVVVRRRQATARAAAASLKPRRRLNVFMWTPLFLWSAFTRPARSIALSACSRLVGAPSRRRISRTCPNRLTGVARPGCDRTRRRAAPVHGSYRQSPSTNGAGARRPLVVQPVTTSVSTARSIRLAGKRACPKNAGLRVLLRQQHVILLGARSRRRSRSRALRPSSAPANLVGKATFIERLLLRDT